MTLRDNLRSQLQTLRVTFLLVLVVSVALSGSAVVLHYWKGIAIKDLTGDPVSVLKGPAYTGYLSQAGLLMWAATVSVCFFAAGLESGRSEDRSRQRFLLLSGFLTLLLALDDAFLFHEQLFPEFLGVPQLFVYLCYAALTLLWMVRSAAVICQTDCLLLGLAFAFFGASVAIDVVNPQIRGHYLLEDGAKLTGIVCWLAYFWRTASAVSRQKPG